jgi:hypothetical protein
MQKEYLITKIKRFLLPLLISSMLVTQMMHPNAAFADGEDPPDPPKMLKRSPGLKKRTRVRLVLQKKVLKLSKRMKKEKFL